MRIFKYTLAPRDMQEVMLPQGATPLYVAEQFGNIVLYAHVLPDRPMEPRTVWIHGTGHETQFSQEAKPLGVVTLEGGALMFHVFIEPEGFKP